MESLKRYFRKTFGFSEEDETQYQTGHARGNSNSSPYDSYPGWLPPEDPRSDDKQEGKRDNIHENHNDMHGFHSDMGKAMQEMESAFDEIFRIFGADNIPFFDPFVPPSHAEYGSRLFGERKTPNDPDANVRNRMLKDSDSQGHSQDVEDINVRNKMLKPVAPSSRNRPNGSEFDRRFQSVTPKQDRDLDSLIAQGKDINEILDGDVTTSPNAPGSRDPSASPEVKSFYRYSSVVTTRRPDGTIETRRVTRDEKGNETETVEVTKDSSGGDITRDSDIRSRFFKDHHELDQDWIKRFFKW